MSQAEDTLQGHLRDLIVLRDRMKPDHVAFTRVEARIDECREAIQAQREVDGT